MGDIKAKIKISGLTGDAPQGSSFSHSVDADSFQSNWSLEFTDPYVVQDADVVSVDLELYSSTVSATSNDGNIVSDGAISSWGVQLGDSLVTTASGIKSANEEPTSSPEKTLYFVNSAWINRLAGGKKSWTFRDNALYWIKSGRNRTGKVRRIEHADLPSADMPTDSYELRFCSKHHDVLSYLVSKLGYTYYSGSGEVVQTLGYTLVTNVPNLDINHSFVVSSGETYIDAINRLVALWNPLVKIVHRATSINGLEYPGVVYILETTGDTHDKEQPKTVVIDDSALMSGVEFSFTGPNQNDLIDKVIIKGGALSGSVELPDPGELKLTKLDAMEIDIENLLNFFHVEQMNDILGAKRYGDYKKGFNEQDAPDQIRVDKILKSETYYQNPDDRTQLLLMAEATESMDENGQTVHTHTTSNQYAETGELVRSTETERALVNEPGVPFKKMREVLHRTIDQSRIYDGIQRSNVLEIVEEPVVVTKVIPQTGEPYYAGPVRLIQAQSQNRVSTDVSTTQELIEMTTRVKMSKVHRVTKTVLRQIEMEWDNLSGTMHCQTQIVADPRIQDADEEPRYYNEIRKPGVIQFHKSATVEHPDIVTDTVAQLVADLIFLRSSQRKTNVTIRPKVFIPILDTAYDVRIPTIQVQVSGASGTAIRTITGGTYRMIKSDFQASMGTGSDCNVDQTLSLRNVL